MHIQAIYKKKVLKGRSTEFCNLFYSLLIPYGPLIHTLIFLSNSVWNREMLSPGVWYLSEHKTKFGARGLLKL